MRSGSGVERQELRRRLASKGWKLEWADIVHDLTQLHETTIHIDDHEYVVRSETKGIIGKVFQACGVAVPPVLRPARRRRATAKKMDRRVTIQNPSP